MVGGTEAVGEWEAVRLVALASLMKLLKWSALTSMISWGEEIVIYQHQTGDTHLFCGFAKQVVALCLSKEAFSVAELIEWTRDCCQDVNDSRGYVDSIINDLIRKHMIVSLSS